MAVGDLDIERVTALLKRAVAELVLPSFRRLAPGDVERKLTPGFMSAEQRGKVEAWPRERFTPGQPSGCSALEYTNIAQGYKDFVVYHRLLPWDHAPGALVLSEAGGSTTHLDGRAYTAGSRDQVTITAGSERVSGLLRQWLLE